MEINKEEVEIKNVQGLEGIKEGVWRSPKYGAKKVALTFLSLSQPFSSLLPLAQSFSLIKHERVMKFIGMSYLGKDEKGNEKVVMISEFPEKGIGSVFSSFHEQKSNFTNFGKLKILHQTAEVISSLHSIGYSHFRINSRNILMDGELNIWISIGSIGLFDLGNSTLTNFYFHSPEYISFLFNQSNNGNNDQLKNNILFYDDIYSIGIFIYELIANRIPFSRLFQSPAANGGKELLTEFGREVENGRIRPTFPPDIDRSLLPLVPLCSDCFLSPPSERANMEKILSMLTSTYAMIIFENSNHDLSRNFWLSSFPLSLTASVEEVTEKIYQFVNITEVNTAALEFLSLKAALSNLLSLPLGSNGEKAIKMRDFLSAMEYIGPISRTMISSSSSLIQKTWFHGLMGREEADRAIKDQEIGTFLFRWSKSEVGCYSLTVKNADEIKHFRIGHSLSSPFTLGNVDYESLDEILLRYKKELYLKIPCPNSVFKVFITSAELNRNIELTKLPEYRYFSVDEILS